MGPYSLVYRQKLLARMSGRDAISARQLSVETGVHEQTLCRWREEARSLPLMPKGDKKAHRLRTIEDKVRILAKAATLSGDELSTYLDSEKVRAVELEQWRMALSGGRAHAATLRIRKLERELARKEKALAEAAALLVLKKKVEELFPGDEDSDTDEGSEK